MKNYKEMLQDELDVELLDACFHKDLEKVKYLLESPDLTLYASISANPYDTYDSPLRMASEAGSLEIVKYLMTKNIHTQDFHIALGGACEKGEVEIVKYFLLEHGDRVDINDYIYTLEVPPLVCALTTNQVQIVDFLLNSTELKENAQLMTQDDNMPSHVVINTPRVLEHDAFYIASSSTQKEVIDIVMNCEQFKSYPFEKKLKALENAFWGERKENIEYFITHSDFDFTSEYENVFVRACQTQHVDNIRYFNQYYNFKESNKAWESILKNEEFEPDFIQYLIVEKNWNPNKSIVQKLEQSNIKGLISSIIKSKELNESLEYNLGVKEVNSKKLKI
jgi:ankyrin repeat protein